MACDRNLVLTRFGGDRNALHGGVHHGENAYALSAGVPAPLIELVRAGRSPTDLAREFEPSAEAIRNWVKQAERDAGRRTDRLPSDEREELARLRREVRHLRQE